MHEGEVDFLQALSEMIIFTATRCLHGREVRERFDEEVANLYHDLDNGYYCAFDIDSLWRSFTPLAWFLPPWIPFPSFRARDRARVELQRRFNEVCGLCICCC